MNRVLGTAVALLAGLASPTAQATENDRIGQSLRACVSAAQTSLDPVEADAECLSTAQRSLEAELAAMNQKLQASLPASKGEVVAASQRAWEASHKADADVIRALQGGEIRLPGRYMLIRAMSMRLNQLHGLAELLVQVTPNQSVPAPTSLESTDIDAAVRKVIAEMAVFVDECGVLFPEDKSTLDAAFANWVVLKLPIPNLATALDPGNSDRVELARLIGPYLRQIPGQEKEIECGGRYEMLISEEPWLGGDSAKLPPDVLERYVR